MRKLLVKLTPLEPYFFGGENTYRIGEDNKYYISSLKFPSMSSVIGMMRYELLKSNDILRSDGKYDESARQKYAELVGKTSYLAYGENAFGKLLGLSPLFIMHGDDRLIRTPLNHKTCYKDSNDKTHFNTIYTPFEFTQDEYETSSGRIKLPAHEQFNAKNTVGDSDLTCLNNLKIYNCEEDKILIGVERVGISKPIRYGNTDIQKTFFKKYYYMLAEGYSFAFTAEIADDAELSSGICYMGREKSPFKMEVSKTTIDIENEIEVTLSKSNSEGEEFIYIFGDTFVNGKIKYKGFSMVRAGTVRILGSTVGDNGLRLSKGKMLYNIIKSGSVFYGDKLPDECVCTCGKFGFNKYIKITNKPIEKEGQE